MIKDYWVYQNDGAVRPWSLYVVKEYEKGKKTVNDCAIDLTVYHEDIPNSLHALSTVGISGKSVSDIVGDVETFIIDSIPTISFTARDHAQLQEAFLNIFMD